MKMTAFSKNIFLLLLAVAPAAYSNQEQATTTAGTIRDFMIDALFLEYIGSKAVNSLLDTLIRDVLTQADIKDVDKVRIRRFSHWAPRENACVIELLGVTYVFVDEGWFVTLPIDQQKFIIAHEIMHIKHHHIRNRIIYLFGSLLSINLLSGFSKGIIKGLNPEITLERNKKIKLIDSITSLLNLAVVLGIFPLARYQESQADQEAVKLLKSGQAGKDFFNYFIECQAQIESEFAQWELLKSKRKFFKEFNQIFFGTHPRLKYRIAAIEQLEAQGIV